MPKRTIRNNSNKIVLFNQKLKDIEHIYRDVSGYDMNYDEFKEKCRKSWEEDYNYLCIDRYRKREQGRYCICNENNDTYLECIPETKPFDYHTKLYLYNYDKNYIIHSYMNRCYYTILIIYNYK